MGSQPLYTQVSPNRMKLPGFVNHVHLSLSIISVFYISLVVHIYGRGYKPWFYMKIFRQKWFYTKEFLIVRIEYQLCIYILIASGLGYNMLWLLKCFIRYIIISQGPLCEAWQAFWANKTFGKIVFMSTAIYRVL